MRLNKFGYYGDFVVYPLAVAALAAGAVRVGPLLQAEWISALGGGMVLWTLMEYLIHRLVLHRPGVFMRMHEAHHAEPRGYIGTPWWISVSTLCMVVGLPAWLGGGLNFAGGLTAGVMVGYWWYGIVHHVIHHRTRTPLAGHFHALRLHHLRHHHGPARCNFGVTTPLWDVLLRTRVDRAAPAGR
jgi:sterol desaturase/sphingolipid hydroxylase (fatty acid hydroxylase superfamily)